MEGKNMSEDKKTTVLQEKYYGAAAFIPLIVFLAIYLGSGFYFTAQGVESPFSQIPRDVALLIGIACALFMGKRSLNEQVSSFAKAAGDPGVMHMCLIFILAGVFTGIVKGMGGVDSTVNLGLTFIPVNFLVPGMFLISLFASTAMGTCLGTIAAIAPIAVGLAEATGLDMAIMLSAVIGGSMFGDNMSIISDTTIAATRIAGCGMKDKFRMNIKIALPAVFATVLIYTIIGGTASGAVGPYDYDIVKVIPYIVVLALAIAGIDVMLVLAGGAVLAGVIGAATGTLNIVGVAKAASSGISGMMSLVLIAILLKGLTGLITDMGGMTWLTTLVSKNIKTRKGAQYSMAVIISVVDFCIGNNTICIIILGPILKPIAKKFRISPQKFASFLDIWACVMPGLSPIGLMPMTAIALTALSPIDVIRHGYYPIFLAISALVTIQFDLFKTKEEKEGASFYPELDEENMPV